MQFREFILASSFSSLKVAVPVISVFRGTFVPKTLPLAFWVSSTC